MNAVHALALARAAGVRIGVDGNDLTLEAAAAPPPVVLELLTRHKAQVFALLRPGRDGWSGEDWKVLFDERAGIAEFEGGLPRVDAEVGAFDSCVIEWLNRNPRRSPPGRCGSCDQPARGQDLLWYFDIEPAGHTWLHSRCWPIWQIRGKLEAAAALAIFEIYEPRTSP